MAFSTPLICCSRVVMTVSAMVFGEAPGYWPLTTTVGGTISGYSLMGSAVSASKPANVMRMASTAAKIGRSMKKAEIFIAASFLVSPGGRGRCRVRLIRAHGDELWCDLDARLHALSAAHDDDIPGLQAVAHD